MARHNEWDLTDWTKSQEGTKNLLGGDGEAWNEVAEESERIRKHLGDRFSDPEFIAVMNKLAGEAE